MDPHTTETDWRVLLDQIMRRRGAKCTPEQFHQAVNIAFHRFESEEYDELHQDMWKSLPCQFELLVGDYIEAVRDLPPSLSVLDLGCGTGLASDLLCSTALGRRIRRIHLVDTSHEMLARAKARAESWNVPVSWSEGTIESVESGERYDVIVSCSVLHHVPDVQAFAQQVRFLQNEGGIFLHLQDPNGDYMDDLELRKRTAAAAKRALPDWAYRLTPRRVGGRLYRCLTGRPVEDYLWRTNRELLAKGIIEAALSVGEIFTITDVHVQDGKGISIRSMGPMLEGYRLLSVRSYGFFGKLWSELPNRLQREEAELIAKRAPNGAHVGAVWMLSER